MISDYERRGVSAQKQGVREATKKLDEGLFPGAFCKVFPDLCGDPKHGIVYHVDGAGTKAGLAYLAIKTMSGVDKKKIWRGVAQDSMVMNTDDAICIGATGPFYVSMALNRNKFRITDEDIALLIGGTNDVCEEMTKFGIECYFTAGETADVGDLSRTLDVDHFLVGRVPLADVIDASKIAPGAYIVGFSSTGQAVWESEPNSSIGSNGLTNARHDCLSPQYRVHMETYSPETDPSLIYRGKFSLDDLLPGDDRFTIGSALLSPTRTYAPMVAKILKELGPRRAKLLALIHCSGGGQSKIGKFGPPGVRYVKNRMLPIPPLFRMLHEVRGLSWKQMYESYNMGVRLEAVTSDLGVAELCIAVAGECGIAAGITGGVVEVGVEEAKEVRVLITTDECEVRYPAQ